MYLRVYHWVQAEKNKDGTIYMHHHNGRKWIKSKGPQRKYRPRGQAKTMWSKRFGYIDNYTRKEQSLLRCPSGYTFCQNMGALRKLWGGYMNSLVKANIDKMEEYAHKIQETQEDMGLKTSSFPHLGIYGDVLVFTDHKTKEITTQIDHSHLKAKQDLEEEKEKLEEMVPALIEADIEKGEELITITDEIPQPKPKTRYRVKHENRMHYGKGKEEEWVCENCDETVPPNKNHICKHKEEGEEKDESVITMTDDIPFQEF